ncbi:MAG: hypothetical protein ABIW30_01285 [Arenimonas sp.]
MSILNKKTAIAFAVAAALMPFAASAITVTYDAGAAPGNQAPVYAQNVFLTNAAVIATTQPLTISATNADAILGRTTGFNIRITLNSGQFAITPASATVGAGLPNSTTAAPWTVTKAGGGTNVNTVTYAINPPASGTGFGVIEGALITFPTGSISFKNLASLANGGSLTGTIVVQDPVGGGTLATVNVTFIVTEEGVVVVCDPADGNTAKRIDVAAVGGFAGKTRFSPTGAIGASTVGPGNLYFNAGSIDLSTQDLTGGFGGANNSGGNFVFDETADLFSVVVTGTNFAPFNAVGTSDRVFISVFNDCSTQDAVGTVNAAQTSATIDFVLTDLGFGETGGKAYICLQQSASATPVKIDAQALNASVTVDIANAAVGDPAADFDCPLLPLRFNGSVVKVATFNPGANTTAQSFLRVTNPTASLGKVTIDTWDDTGLQGGSVSFNLAAGASRQINSDVLEAGGVGLTGAAGDGTGKWRLLVTGELGGMRVASLNRNNTDGTVTNLTDYDTNAEQSTPTTGAFGTPLSQFKGSDPN